MGDAALKTCCRARPASDVALLAARVERKKQVERAMAEPSIIVIEQLDHSQTAKANVTVSDHDLRQLSLHIQIVGGEACYIASCSLSIFRNRETLVMLLSPTHVYSE